MTEIANEPDASLQVSNRLVLYDIVGTNSGGQEGSHAVRPRTMSEIKTSRMTVIELRSDLSSARGGIDRQGNGEHNVRGMPD